MRFWISALLVTCLFLPLSGEAKTATARKIEGTLGEFFGLYTLKAGKRSRNERVVVKKTKRGYEATLSYWRSLKGRKLRQNQCEAYHWLLFGRGSYGKGAKAAFAKYPRLNAIYLRFFDEETGTRLGKKKGVILPTQRLVVYLRVGVKRNSLLRKSVSKKTALNKLEAGRCPEVAKSYIDVEWVNRKYLAKQKRS